jgi:PAS domain S-box-containing protein
LVDILVVDDNPDTLWLLIHLLKQQGYKVRPAADGQRALAAAHLSPPDLILLDVMMPEMSGYEVCEALKADEATRAIPVIFISALDQVFDKVRAFSAGGVDYIEKPFQNAEVLARVRTHLAVHQLQAELRQANQQLQHEIEERKEIESALWQRNQELLALQATGEAISSSLDLRHVLDSVIRALQELLDIQGCTISEWHRDRNAVAAMPEQTPTFWVSQEFNSREYDLNDYPLTRKVLVEQKPAQVNAGQADADPAEVALIHAAGGQALLMVPMISSGETLGLIELLECRAERTFSETEIALAQLLANQAATAVQNARLYEQAQQEIGERKLAEAKLRQSEERYRSVVEDQTEVIARQQADGTLTFVNDVHCRFFGKSRQELLGQKWQPMVVAEDLPAVEAKLSTLSSANPVVVVENRSYAGNGEIRWMQFVNRGFFDEQGQLVEIQAVGRDITERKQLEQMLEKQNRTLQALYRTILDIGSELNVPTLLPRILKHAVELLDAERGGGIYLYDSDEQVLRLVEGLGINQGRNGVTMQLGEGVAGRVFQSGEPLIVNDYTNWEGRRTVLVSYPSSAVMGVPLFLAGQVTGVLAVFANSQRRTFDEEDVSLAELFAAQVTVALQNARLYEQAQQEIGERKEAEAKLRESEERYRSVVEGQTEMIARLRWDGTHIFVNDVYCRFFGKSRPELVGQRWQPLAVAEDVAAIEAQLSTMSPVNPDVVIENRVHAASGEVRWMQFANRGFFDEGGQLVEIQTVGRDITARKQAELLLQETNASLQQRISELVILRFVAQTLTTVTDIQPALDTVVTTLNHLFNTYGVSISIFDPASKEIKIVASHKPQGADVSTSAPATEAESGLDEQAMLAPLSLFRGRLLEERRPLTISQAQTGPELTSVQRLFQASNIHDLLLVPLQARGEVIGFLTLATDQPGHEFTPAEERLAETVAGQIAGAVKIVQLFEEERRQRLLAQSMRRVTAVLSSSLEQPKILAIIFEQLQQVLQFDGALIGLIEDDVLVIVQAVGRSVRYLDYRLPVRSQNCLTEVLQQRQAVILTNMAEAESWPTWFRPREQGSWMGVPLGVGRTVLGLLAIEQDPVGAFRHEDADILQTFADQAALAIENARLYAQAQTVAIDAERQRLARDLHDSVTQSLYSLTLLTNGWAATARRGESDVPQMAKQFKQLEQISLEGLKEMRLLLFQLRPPILEEVGLVGALQQRLDSVEQRVNLKTRLLIHGAVDELPLAVAEQLLAIAQEALTNVLRHAEATEVIVLLRREDGRLTLNVTDNGIGFDPTVPNFGLGLGSIRERTETIGGQVKITSAPQQGTTVMVTVDVPPSADGLPPLPEPT